MVPGLGDRAGSVDNQRDTRIEAGRLRLRAHGHVAVQKITKGRGTQAALRLGFGGDQL